MLKILKLLFLALIVVVIVVLVYANSLVSTAIEVAGSQALGTKVSVDFVSINPFAGTASISQISIANPDGFAEENALELCGFSAEIDIASLFSEVVHVKELRIKSPMVLLEQKNGNNNLTSLYSHLQGMNGDQTSADAAPQKRLVIDNLYVDAASVRLIAPQFKDEISPLSVKIPDIHLKDIGKNSNGATIGHVAKLLIGKIRDEAVNINLAKFGAGALKQLGKKLGVDADQLIKGRAAEVDQFKGLLGTK